MHSTGNPLGRRQGERPRRQEARRSIGARVLATLVLCLLPEVSLAQNPDVVEVASGDRVRGDVSRLQRGQLAFRTISAGAGRQRFAGTISVVWTEVVSLTSDKTLDVETRSGERFTGSISSPSPGRLIVQTAAGPSRSLDVGEVIGIILVESGFRGRTTGSIDFGFAFTNADDVRMYTLDAEANHNSSTYAYETRLAFNSWLSARDNADRLTRNDFTGDVRRRFPNRWFALATGAVQQDSPQDLNVRLLLGGGVGRTLVQSNRTVFSAQGGVDYDGEDYGGIEFEHSAEAFGGINWDWFAGDSDLGGALKATTFISLARQRARVQVDGNVRHDLFANTYWSFNVYESFDSDPPVDRPRSDLGLSFALGWTF
jgi:hypothetical protein